MKADLAVRRFRLEIRSGITNRESHLNLLELREISADFPEETGHVLKV